MAVKHVVSLSGGKDSTAMLLILLEKNIRIDEIVFFDTTVEYPAMYRHIKKVQEYISRPIKTLKAPYSFEEYMLEKPITRGKRKGERGYGWPTAFTRWCTRRLKIDVSEAYSKNNGDAVWYIGISSSETRRVKNKTNKYIYPLVDMNIGKEETLQYCKNRGFNWEGLYEHSTRTGCYLCPLQNLRSLRNIRKYYPELWERMKVLDKLCIERGFLPFRLRFSIEQADKRFELEDRQQELFPEESK